MLLRPTGVYVLLLVLPHISQAFVDIFKYKYKITIDALDEIREIGNSYFDEEIQLLNSYTGPKAQQCKEERGNEAITRVELQTIMIGVTGKVQTTDKKISASVQKCYGDGSCIAKAMFSGELKLNALKSQVIPEILSIKNNGLKNVNKFMDKCISE